MPGREDAHGARLAGRGRARAAAAARLRHRGERPRPARRHRPALRRRPGPAHPPGDPRRDRRGAGRPRVLRDHRAPAARGLPHQRGARGLPGPGAHPGAVREPGPHVRRGAGDRARGHRVHHAHAGARGHRPLPGRHGRATTSTRTCCPACRPTACSRSARRTTRTCSTWRTWACAWPSAPTGCRSCTARCRASMFGGLWDGLRRRRGADRLGHQRRARQHVGGARGRRADRGAGPPRVPRRCTDERALGPPQRPARAGWSRRCAAACARPGCSAARRCRSWAGPSTSSTPTCSPSGSPVACRPTSGSRSCCATRTGCATCCWTRSGPVQLVVAGQVAPRRRRRQGAHPGDRPFRRRPGGAAPDRVPARLRHVDGPLPLLGLRRVAEQPAATAGGVRHVGDEVGAQRWAQPVDPRRLVGRALRRPQRLGDPHRRRHRRPAPARRPGGQRALRAARHPGGARVLRADRPGAAAVGGAGAPHARHAAPAGAGHAHGARVRGRAVRARGAGRRCGRGRRIRGGEGDRRVPGAAGRVVDARRGARRRRLGAAGHPGRGGADDGAGGRAARRAGPGGRHWCRPSSGRWTRPTTCATRGRCRWSTSGRPTRRGRSGSRRWSPLPFAGLTGYTVRVLPNHPLLASPAELGKVVLA